MTRYVCIHGHFYQPPRENPWLETIERQASVYPFPNWNERILAECYRPNASSRIVDGHGRIVQIANNYEKISFNFGPTLLSWMEASAPDVYRALMEAGEDVGLATVYRVLTQFEAAGLVVRHNFAEGRAVPRSARGDSTNAPSERQRRRIVVSLSVCSATCRFALRAIPRVRTT